MNKCQEGFIDLEDSSQKDKYLIFSLGKNEYGLDIKYVKEIVVIHKITEVSETQKYIKGIINLRGKGIPVIDARMMLGKMEKEYTERTCTIVLEINHLTVGLIVESVAEVLSIAEEDIAPPPNINSIDHIKHIKGIAKTGSNVKLLLDCEKLSFGQELGGMLENDTSGKDKCAVQI